MREASAPLAAVDIFNCARAPEEFELVEFSGPLTLVPLTAEAEAAAADMRVCGCGWT